MKWFTRARVGVAIVFAVSGCAGAANSAISSTTPSDSSSSSSATSSLPASPRASWTQSQAPVGTLPITCGTATDVANEPDWRQYADYRAWATSDGCAVRIDVLADRPGPAHCGYQAARVIVTGIPIGARYSNERNAATYVRDPTNVFGDSATASAFDPHATLPMGAVDTGLRQKATQLWFDATNPTAIYLVTGATVERWPLDPHPSICS